MSKILIADDEARIRKLVKDFLVREGYEVLEAGDGEEALNIFDTTPDLSLLLLDVMMPKMDGFEVAKYVRQRSNIPIMMLTAKSEEEDELQGFDIGVDEYIAKPFSPKILVARISAVIRRSEQGKNISDDGGISSGAGGAAAGAASHILSAGSPEKSGVIEVNIDAHVVRVDGNDVPMSVKEFELLTFFIENEGIALSRDTILNKVWNYDYFGDARTIDTHVKKLRSKLGNAGDYIKTIWGMGYKFETA